MPHINIQYSQNLQPDIDIQHLCETVRQACLTIEAFPMAGIRCGQQLLIIMPLLMVIRHMGLLILLCACEKAESFEVRQAAIQDIFDVAKAFLGPSFETRSIALSAEIIDINAELSPKSGTIRAHLADG